MFKYFKALHTLIKMVTPIKGVVFDKYSGSDTHPNIKKIQEQTPVNEGPPSVDTLVFIKTMTGNPARKEPLKEIAELVNESPITKGYNAIGPFSDRNGHYWYVIRRDGKSEKIYCQECSEDYLEATRKRVDINV